MKFSEIGRLLFDDLAVQLLEQGFKSRWSRRDFVRTEGWGASKLHLFYYNYPDRLGVSGELIIRIEEVHRLLDPFLTDREPKYVRQLPTLDMEIAQHLRHTWKELILWSEDDVPATVQEMARIMREVAEPFYQKYHSVEAAYKLLRSEDSHNQAYSMIVYQRGMTLLAMAKILGKEEDLPLIAEEYRVRITKAKELSELSMFEALLASLI